MSSITKATILSPYNELETCSQIEITDPSKTLHLSNQIKFTDKYTIGFWLKASSNTIIPLTCGTSTTNINATTSWNFFSYTFSATNGADITLEFISGTYYIYHMKLERGEKATDWLINTSDIMERISENSIRNWCYNNDLNYIDGAKVQNETITSNKMNVNNLQSISNSLSGFTLGVDNIHYGLESLVDDEHSGIYLGTDGFYSSDGINTWVKIEDGGIEAHGAEMSGVFTLDEGSEIGAFYISSDGELVSDDVEISSERLLVTNGSVDDKFVELSHGTMTLGNGLDEVGHYINSNGQEVCNGVLLVNNLAINGSELAPIRYSLVTIENISTLNDGITRDIEIGNIVDFRPNTDFNFIGGIVVSMTNLLADYALTTSLQVVSYNNKVYLRVISRGLGINTLTGNVTVNLMFSQTNTLTGQTSQIGTYTIDLEE